MKDIHKGSLSPECNLHICLQKPPRTMKWKPSAALLHIHSHLPKLFPPSPSPPSSPSCQSSCHERGVLIIQPISPCVCRDSCRWENSHRESNIEGFCSRFSCEAHQWENIMGSCWTLICRTDYCEQPVSTSPFGFFVHAYFTSAVSKIFNLCYWQIDA